MYLATTMGSSRGTYFWDLIIKNKISLTCHISLNSYQDVSIVIHSKNSHYVQQKRQFCHSISVRFSESHKLSVLVRHTFPYF